MKPKVSIIIPVYNGSNYMRDAIESAINQSYDNCEIIVVNDGSTDGGATEEIAKSYGEKIRYIYKENGGVATAVNLGIQNMTGEYFSWLSHDDVFYKDKIKLQMEAILSSGDKYSICHGNFDFLYMEKDELVHVDFLEQYTKAQLENGNFSPVFLCIHGSTVLFHKDHFERVGLYREDLKATQDSEFLYRVMRNQNVVFVEDSLIIGRIHKEQGQQTMKEHKPEYNDMFIGFCEDLGSEEKIKFAGSEMNFYYRLYCLLKNSKPSDEILPYLRNKIEEYKKEYEKEYEDLPKIHLNIINDIKYYSKEKKLYIFGAGAFGKEALHMLQSYNIKNITFLDNDEKKDGRHIKGVECKHVKHIDDRDIFVVVAMRDSKDVINQLEDLGVKNIIKYLELNRQLFFDIPDVINL